MKDQTIVALAGIAGLTCLGIVYFVFLKQDSSVLASLCSGIGVIVGYVFGKGRR